MFLIDNKNTKDLVFKPIVHKGIIVAVSVFKGNRKFIPGNITQGEIHPDVLNKILEQEDFKEYPVKFRTQVF